MSKIKRVYFIDENLYALNTKINKVDTINYIEITSDGWQLYNKKGEKLDTPCVLESEYFETIAKENTRLGIYG